MAILQDRNGKQHHLIEYHRLGRTRSMHTVLSATEASPQHAQIEWTGSDWTIRDLGSKNGTFINGRRLENLEPHPLVRGAVLEFGSAADRFEVIDDGPPASELAAASEARMALPTDNGNPPEGD